MLASALSAQSLVRHVGGDDASDFLGLSVAGVGDVDGDGHDDVAVGVRGADTNGPESGAARVYSGRTGALLLEVFGNSAWDYFGLSVAGVGDVDGDGIPDVAFGAPRDDSHVAGGDSGTVEVWSVARQALIYEVRGETSNEQFGRFIDALGDVDDDGYDDFAVGAPFADGYRGIVRVISGVDGSVLFELDGAARFDEFGRSLGGAGDVDGDGTPDVVVGARLHDPSGLVDAGAAYVFSGVDGQLLHSWFGTEAGSQFGQSVQGAGDVDADGRADVIVGAHLFAAGGGSASVFSGATGELLWRFDGAAGSNLGRAVDTAGDVDGDGHADVIAGADLAGAAFVFSGRTGGLLFDLSSAPSAGLFGHAVAGSGDVDGDGFDDVIVGAYREDGTGGTDAGGVHLFSSDAVGLPPRVREFGRACPTTLGNLPRASTAGRSLIGESLMIGLRSALDASGAWIQIGLPARLPLDPFGATGCVLEVHPLVSAGYFIDENGRATMHLPIPDDVVLGGVEIAAQWVIADVFANPLGIVTSTAVRIRIGLP